MFLKSLQIHGFKSFADKTLLPFDAGITGVVGPNGCGKSNVVDAIRWALGEQSARSLRGGKMEDVLFSGSQTRKPLSMAEVTLTFDNDNGNFASQPGFRELAEIRIARRLYRSGESEYLINDIPCRLKDITELMVSQSMSPQMLSLMEQGQVDGIIKAKPIERRFLIDEVAGIAQFKHRKIVAVRKLEAAEANLTRVRDILDEVRRQRNSLNRQAKKAERYRQCRDEIRRVDLGVLGHEYEQLRAELQEIERSYYDAKGREAHLASRLADCDQRAEAGHTALEAMERAVHELRERLHTVERAADASEHQRTSLHDQSTERRRALEEIWLEIENLRTEAASFDAEIARQQAERDQQAARLSEAETQLNEQQDSSRRLALELRSLNDQIEDHKGQLMQILAGLAESRNEVTSYETQLALLDKRRERLTQEHAEARQRHSAAHGSLAAEDAALAQVRQALDGERQRFAAAETRLASLDAILEEIVNQRRGIESELLTARTQLGTLEEITVSRQDFNSGVQALFSGEHHNDGAHRLIGVVADFLEVPQEFEVAIEAVLGERLQSIIAEDTRAAVNAINYLKEHAAGRSAFIAQELLEELPIPVQEQPWSNGNSNGSSHGRADGGSNASEHSSPGVVGFALSFVRFKEELRPIFSVLLNQVVIVDELDSGLRCWLSNGFGTTCVTRDGEVIDANGIVVGGRNGEHHPVILARKRQLQELGERIARHENELREVQARGEQQTTERDAAQAERDRSGAALSQLEADADAREREVDGQRRALSSLDEHLSVLDYETQELDRELAELTACLDELRAAVADRQTQQLNAEATIASLQARREELTNQQDKRNAEVESTQQLLAEHRATANTLEIEVTRLRDRCDYLQEIMTTKQRQIDDGEQRLAELRTTYDQVCVQLETQHANSAALKQQLVAETEQLDAARQNLEQLEHERRDVQGALDGTREEVNRHALRRTELGVQVRHREQRCLDEYRWNIEQALTQARLAPEELEGAAARLAELRERLQAMGDVNLAALQEYEELNERYTFLEAQNADLQESIDGLRRAIQKINRTTRERFLSAFEQVQAKFREAYAKISCGGQADLQLTDLDDIWESGLDVVVQPPGKRLQSIGLLSAGEKAMAAIALLVSVFLVRPAPFCIMDEVDAPLDESNINRFLDLVTELAARTQFLLVTHSQRTMSYANVLYGVTMEEQGVSKIVSVRLRSDSAQQDEDPHRQPVTA